MPWSLGEFLASNMVSNGRVDDGDIRKFLNKLSKRTRIPEEALEPF